MTSEQHRLVRSADGRRTHLWVAGREDAPALVLLHGWPDSHVRYRPLVDRLSDRFRLVVPDLPGFGFSDPMRAGEASVSGLAEALLESLTEVGVERFGLYGGDLGTSVAEQMAIEEPSRVTALALSDVPLWRAIDDSAMTDEERAWADGVARWAEEEGAYAHLHRTRPQTLAAGLTDSPAGLASWHLEKFQSWGSGDAFARMPVDFMLENLSIHWFTRSSGTAASLYLEKRSSRPPARRVDVPTAFGLFPHDIDSGPESFARRWYPVERFTRFSRGGHFGAVENPDELAIELSEFFGSRT